ncbi:hypothetical protein Nepgr_011368 [Nepenthes gracilis]|uniref:Uncharacterized protein n=1 Tax=Nepenthes gracilis TaxID=150966 RepID=A0AAD3SF69_NEPGR|nr:hypothetical protein Nepgr_011368 [Nepenthes gracilis]
MSSLAIFFLLFLPLHACIAVRPLDVPGPRGLLSSKGGEKAELNGIGSPLGATLSKEREEERLKNGPNWDGATTMRLKELKADLSTKVTTRKILGNEVVKFAQEGKHEASNIQGLTGIERSTLVSTFHPSEEPANPIEGDEPSEDVGAMDYSQPHKKSPIHHQIP